MARRFDFGRLAKAQPIAGGGVLVPARLTRVGVLEYRDNEGNVTRELRPPEEVFHTDSLASLSFATVTDLHPKEMINANNWKDYAIGIVAGAPREDGQFIAANLAVSDNPAIQKIDRGDRSEVSCGYTCDVEIKTGVFNGERYDAIQRNIRYNHVAIGPENWGRAGSEVSLRLDSGDAYSVERVTRNDSPTKETKNMAKKRYTLDGLTFEFEGDETAFQALDKELAKVDSLTKEIETEKGRADAHEKKATDLKAELEKIPEQIEKRAASMAKLRADSRHILGEEFDYKGKTDREIHIAVIQKDQADFDPKDRSDDYIAARYDALVEKTDNTQREDTGPKPPMVRTDANKGDRLDQAYGKFQSETSDAWKQPLAASTQKGTN